MWNANCVSSALAPPGRCSLERIAFSERLGGRVASQETNEGGIADLEADGQVYHLKNAAHFAGSYQQSPGAAPAGTDPKALVMKNEKGVVVVLEVKVETGTNPYLALDTSDQDVKVTLER